MPETRQIEFDLPYRQDGYLVRIFSNAAFEQRVRVNGSVFEGSGENNLIGTKNIEGGTVVVECQNRPPGGPWTDSIVEFRGHFDEAYPYYLVGSEDQPDEGSAIDYNDSLVYFFHLS